MSPLERYIFIVFFKPLSVFFGGQTVEKSACLGRGGRGYLVVYDHPPVMEGTDPDIQWRDPSSPTLQSHPQKSNLG